MQRGHIGALSALSEHVKSTDTVTHNDTQSVAITESLNTQPFGSVRFYTFMNGSTKAIGLTHKDASGVEFHFGLGDLRNHKVDQSGGVLDTDQRGGYPGPLIESTGRPHE